MRFTQRLKSFIPSCFLTLSALAFSPLRVFATEGFSPTAFMSERFGPAINQFIADWNGTIHGVLAFTLLTSLLMLIINFMRLGASAHNSQARTKVLHDVMVVAICTAILGSFEFVYLFIVYIAAGA